MWKSTVLGGRTVRIDKFLKISRLIKRRTVANEACDSERISVNGKVVKASYDVKVGDVIEIRFGQRTVAVEVLEVNEYANKSDAHTMYREIVREGT
jgi:ribosomal 50S subunit-recycling heat shock protein